MDVQNPLFRIFEAETKQYLNSILDSKNKKAVQTLATYALYLECLFSNPLALLSVSLHVLCTCWHNLFVLFTVNCNVICWIKIFFFFKSCAYAEERLRKSLAGTKRTALQGVWDRGTRAFFYSKRSDDHDPPKWRKSAPISDWSAHPIDPSVFPMRFSSPGSRGVLEPIPAISDAPLFFKCKPTEREPNIYKTKTGTLQIPHTV